MADARARQLYDQKDFVGLFRYIEPMWIVVTLQILDDLTDRGFTPNFNLYQSEFRQAGINVKRLEVAMSAVSSKRARQITWGKFWEVQEEKLSTLPLQQKQEIHDYWFAGPIPGLSGNGDQAAPVVGNSGNWFVTSFGGTTESVVVSVGFTALTGNITFTRADGTQSPDSIGVMGPSIGASVIPGSGKVAKALASRFPALNQLLFPESVPKLSNDLLKWLTSSSSLVAKALWKSPTLVKLAKLIPAVTNVGTGASFGPASLPSPAIGLVAANNGRTLQMADFTGSCVMFSAAGNAAVAGGGVFALAFGLPKAWNPFSDPLLNQATGFALILAASISAQVPNLSLSETLFWGEIL